MARTRVERPTPTHLAAGMEGAYRGRPFRILGGYHVQAAHGARWNEWALELEGGGRAWLAERSEGLVLLEADDGGRRLLEARLGAAVPGYVVNERDVARRTARWGAPPRAPSRVRYAEAHGGMGEVVAVEVDGRGRHWRFVGRSVTAGQLGLPARAGAPLLFWEAGASLPVGTEPPFTVGERIALGARRLRVQGLLLRSAKGERWCEAIATEARRGVVWIARESTRSARAFAQVAPALPDVRGARVSLAGVTYTRHAQLTVSTLAAEGLFPFEVLPGRHVQVTEYRGPGGRRAVSERSETELVWLAAGPLEPLGVTAGEG